MRYLVLLATLLLIAMPAKADTVGTGTFTSDHCTNGCGPQPTGFATITGTDHLNGTIDISITLLNGNGLVNTGFPASFAWNLVGDPTLTFSNFSNAGLSALSTTAGSIGMDGFGTFEYGITYDSNGGSNPLFGTFSFTISGVGLSLASFAELSTTPPGDTKAFFVLDIISGTNGNTGLVDCCVGQPTPFSAVPGPIAGAGLPGLLAACTALWGFQRRRRNRIA